jgi:hypothetical protein
MAASDRSNGSKPQVRRLVIEGTVELLAEITASTLTTEMAGKGKGGALRGRAR